MAYPVNIVMNDRNWYDSRIIETNPVVYQNVNYTTGNDRSVNKVRHRFLQDWARRIIPNSIRQGIGLGDPAGGSNQISVTEGYAIVGGRFINIPSGTFDASEEGLTGSGSTPENYYLVIKISNFLESDTRDPSSETATLEAISSSSYSKSHNELVIAKFRYNGSVIDEFEDYTAEQEWQANVLSPTAARPGRTSSSNSILLRAGSVERVSNLGIETNTTRFYLNAVFEDQTNNDAVKLINNSGILETRNEDDDAYFGQDMLNLLIGGTEIITSSGNLINITTINSRGIGTDTGDALIDRTSSQTMTNKTLSSPTITSPSINSPILDLPQINDTSDDHQYIFAVNELTGDRTITLPSLVGNDTFVFEDHSQTLANKTLETLVIQDSDQSHTGEISLPNLTSDITYSISQTSSDTFVMLNQAQTITGAKTFSSDNILNVGSTSWSSANHSHAGTTTGGTIAISNTTGTLTVGRGGTGITTASSDNGVLYGNGTSAFGVASISSASKLLVSQSDGNPEWETPTITLTNDVTGSASMNATGDWSISTTVSNDSHTHDNRYFTETEVNNQVIATFLNMRNNVTRNSGTGFDDTTTIWDFDGEISGGQWRQGNGFILSDYSTNNATCYWYPPSVPYGDGSFIVLSGRIFVKDVTSGTCKVSLKATLQYASFADGNWTDEDTVLKSLSISSSGNYDSDVTFDLETTANGDTLRRRVKLEKSHSSTGNGTTQAGIFSAYSYTTIGILNN